MNFHVLSCNKNKVRLALAWWPSFFYVLIFETNTPSDSVMFGADAIVFGSVHTTNLKGSSISLVRPTIYDDSSRKRSFSKTLFKPGEFENAGFPFSCERTTFWKRSFSTNLVPRVSHPPAPWSKRGGGRMRDPGNEVAFRQDNYVISLTEFSSNTNPNWPEIAAFLNYSSVVRGRKTFDAFSEWNLRFQIPPA